MSEDVRQLQDMLERATASMGPPDGDMDASTAALRETWRAWGPLLETIETPMPRVAIPPPAPRSARPWRLAAGAVLAASVAIVALAAWIAGSTRRSEAPASVQPVAAPAKGEAPQVAARRPTIAPSTPESLWDDRIDEQIARVGQELICVQQAWSPRADTLDRVRSRLERIHTEIESARL